MDVIETSNRRPQGRVTPPGHDQDMAEEYLTRAVVFSLDLSASQERLICSYAGSRRFAYNWVIARALENLRVRDAECKAGVAETALTPALSWSARGHSKAFNTTKEEVAPWWREVSMHAFRSGISDAAQALANFSASKKGLRRGKPVGFPRFKARNHSTPSVSFVEINHQLSWFHPDRHHIRLMLPQASPDPDVRRKAENLAWVHTIESTRRLYKLVASGRASIQKVTYSFRGGRWQVSFTVRYLMGPPQRRPVAQRKRPGGLVGVDVGINHLATFDQPVPGLSDAEGHVANPRVLERQLKKLAKLDQAIARTKKPSRSHPASKNRTKLLARRARLHGRVSKTRALHLHQLTNALVDRFDAVAIENLDVLGMMRAKKPSTGMKLGRSLSDVSFGEFSRQLTYKCADRGTDLIRMDRFYPSSKTCSVCAEATGAEAGVAASKAKMPLDERVFKCNTYLAVP